MVYMSSSRKILIRYFCLPMSHCSSHMFYIKCERNSHCRPRSGVVGDDTGSWLMCFLYSLIMVNGRINSSLPKTMYDKVLLFVFVCPRMPLLVP